MIRHRTIIKSWSEFAFILMLGTGLARTAGAVVAPNLYELAGKNIDISYSTSSLTGEPRLTYRDTRRSLVFTGDEIRVSRSEIGRQVSVTIIQKPDRKTVTATLLIPAINLGEEAVLFKTYLIKTTHKTSIAGPELVKGQVQFYSTKALRGKASRVDYLQSNLSGVVTISPTCPGPIRPDQECVQPFAGAWVQVFDAAKNIAASAITDKKGMFDVRVSPGKYIVRAGRDQVYPTPIPRPIPIPNESGILNLAPVDPDPVISYPLFPRCPDTPVVVPEQDSVFVSIDCDTGIRGPITTE